MRELENIEMPNAREIRHRVFSFAPSNGLHRYAGTEISSSTSSAGLPHMYSERSRSPKRDQQGSITSGTGVLESRDVKMEMESYECSGPPRIRNV